MSLEPGTTLGPSTVTAKIGAGGKTADRAWSVMAPTQDTTLGNLRMRRTLKTLTKIK